MIGTRRNKTRPQEQGSYYGYCSTDRTERRYHLSPAARRPGPGMSQQGMKHTTGDSEKLETEVDGVKTKNKPERKKTPL